LQYLICLADLLELRMSVRIVSISVGVALFRLNVISFLYLRCCGIRGHSQEAIVLIVGDAAHRATLWRVTSRTGWLFLVTF
jgi:hypothetical protein